MSSADALSPQFVSSPEANSGDRVVSECVAQYKDKYVEACAEHSTQPVAAFLEDLFAFAASEQTLLSRNNTTGTEGAPLTPSQQRHALSSFSGSQVLSSAFQRNAAPPVFPIFFEEPLKDAQLRALFDSFAWWPRSWRELSTLVFRRAWAPDSNVGWKLMADFLARDVAPPAVPSGPELCTEPIRFQCNLCTLELSEVGLPPEGCRAIGHALEVNECLRSLEIVRCPQVGDEGAQALAQGIQFFESRGGNGGLRVLRLDSCNVGCVGTEALAWWWDSDGGYDSPAHFQAPTPVVWASAVYASFSYLETAYRVRGREPWHDTCTRGT
eukprot:Hpha_TRINITY_DN2027_c0_g1::TRINITY_DN2027_c0_g1_i1::g.82875::m.82875